jgi:DNA-binding NtrC family response regulator
VCSYLHFLPVSLLPIGAGLWFFTLLLLFYFFYSPFSLVRAVVLAKGDRITLKDLTEEFRQAGGSSNVVSSSETLKEMELQAIRDSPEKCNGNKSKAAKMLGISRKAFYKRLEDMKCIQ